MKTLLIAMFFLISVNAFTQEAVKAEGKDSSLYLNYTLANNESFLSLSTPFRLSPNSIAAYNKLPLGANLTAGQVIKIPLTPANYNRTGYSSNINEVLIPVYVTFAKEESLINVIYNYNIEDSLIKKWNTQITHSIPAGTNLVIGFLKKKKQAVTSAPVTKEITPAKVTETGKWARDEPAKNSRQKEQPPANTKTPVKGPATIEPAKKKPVSTDVAAKLPVSPNTEGVGSDELFQLAHTAAYDKKDYTLALYYCEKALEKSPGYSDIRIFKGRVLTWTDKLDSARQSFDYVIANDPTNNDVYVAYADLEYWNDNSARALEYANKGLSYNATSKDLLIRKAKILNSLNRLKEAFEIADQLLKADPDNTETRALIGRLKDHSSKNKIGFTYDYYTFDRQFDDPWHLLSIDYSRQTKIGTLGGHINYANRFKEGGVQYELDGYPRLLKNLNGYYSFAYSDDAGIFPKYRGALSLYASLPKSFEGEIGFRYLYFSDATWIYTLAAGKYYKNWYFIARTYLTPGNDNISQSYNATARYYYGGVDDFVALIVGTGISPDESGSNILLNNPYRLISKKISGNYRHSFSNKYILSITAGWVNQEYLPKTKGNQVDAGLSFLVRF